LRDSPVLGTEVGDVVDEVEDDVDVALARRRMQRGASVVVGGV